MQKNSSIAVLVSGGLDSCVLLAESVKSYRRVWPIYVRQGLVWENTELYWLKKYLKAITLTPDPSPLNMERGKNPNKSKTLSLLKGEGGRRPGEGVQPLVILSLPMSDIYGNHWSTSRKGTPGAKSKDKAVYLPGRNLVLSLKPAVFAAMNKIPVLALGSLAHNPFSDAAPAFFRQWGSVLSQGLGTKIRVIAPYRQRSKADVIRMGKTWPLQLSFSCIAPKGKNHCGRCNKCAERRRAFKSAKVEDKTIYVTN